MAAQLATLSSLAGVSEAQATAQADSPLPRVGAMKFGYATGDKPLPGYTIKRGVGVGGFGEVYFAVSDGGKEVALKRIQRNLDVELRGVGHCLNLKHVNLLALYDIRRDEAGDSWVIMEYVAGESLAQALEHAPRGFSPLEQLGWFRGLAAGVAYLHDHGIVHRDLKPANIFRDDGVVKLGDYGLAKFISCSRRSGHTESVGTCHYMAPEIGQGRYGKEIDIYALGIILFEMMTGRVPFEGESAQEIMMKHLTAQPNLADIPASVRGVVAQALAKDPVARFHGVADMLLAFERALDGKPTGPELAAASVPEPEVFVIENEPDEIQFGAVRPTAGSAAATRVEQLAQTRPMSGDPVTRAMHGGWQRCQNWWQGDSLNAPTKTVLVVLLVVALSVSAPYLLPLGLVAGIGYLAYLAVYSLLAAPAPTAAPVSLPAPAVVRRPARGWHMVAPARR